MQSIQLVVLISSSLKTCKLILSRVSLSIIEPRFENIGVLQCIHVWSPAEETMHAFIHCMYMLIYIWFHIII